jgi:hypothetical protein
MRRDTGTGFFEHVNANDFSDDALFLQQALLYEPPARRRFTWLGGLLVLYAVVIAVVVVSVWVAVS